MHKNDAIRIVVVGANAAGLRAAARAKRLLPDAVVTVIDRGKYISYGACGMPYLVSGDIEAADKLRETAYGVIRDPDFFRKAKGSMSSSKPRWNGSTGKVAESSASPF